MKAILLVVIFMLPVVAWGFNLYKLMSCDFQSPYRCEMVHGTGVFVPPASIVTVWFDDDGA